MAIRVAAPEHPREKLERLAKTALASNAAFLADASVTNAELLAQVKALTRQVNNLIRLAVKQFDGADG